MIAQFFAAAVAELSALQLPHWLMIAGSALVIVGAVGALVSSRRRAAASPEQVDEKQLDVTIRNAAPNANEELPRDS
jgi:hypothetical protein